MALTVAPCISLTFYALSCCLCVVSRERVFKHFLYCRRRWPRKGLVHYRSHLLCAASSEETAYNDTKLVRVPLINLVRH